MTSNPFLDLVAAYKAACAAAKIEPDADLLIRAAMEQATATQRRVAALACVREARKAALRAILALDPETPEPRG